jgi:hypothetical protein
LTHVHLGHKGHHHESVNITPWVLFTIFVFGPCEPLIPLVMYSATAGALTVTAVALAFSVTCVATMTVLVMASVKGLNLLPHVNLNRYMHALAGSLITLCGAGVLFLRL